MVINRTIIFSLNDKERQVLEEAKQILGNIVSEYRQHSCDYLMRFYPNLDKADRLKEEEEEEIITAHTVLCRLADDGETKGE